MAKTPHGALLPSSWLSANGINSKLAWWYVKSGWLERVDSRAYIKVGDVVTWVGAVYSLQKLIQLPVHVGGKTALQLLGRAHYVPLGGIKKIFLFSEPKIKPPQWLTKNTYWEEEYVVVNRQLFRDEHLIGIVEREFKSLEISLSAPERAILEVMQLIPNHQSYDEALLLMENLTNLRPDVVQTLLQNCISIKAKRLFLHCADQCEHTWLEEIDLTKIELGKGKRKIAEGGVYYPKYQLSVPHNKSK